MTVMGFSREFVRQLGLYLFGALDASTVGYSDWIFNERVDDVGA